MERALKFSGYFGVLGVIAALLLLCYYTLRPTGGELLIWTCPPSFVLMGLDGASRSTVIIIWLVICLENGTLYGLVGLLLFAIYAAVRRFTA